MNTEIRDYNVLGRQFKFELHEDDELTSNMIRWFGYNIEPETVYMYNFLLRPGDVFFDVGANIGWNTLFASFAVESNGAVYAFEPEEKNFNRLEKNIKLNELNNVRACKIALSDKLGFGSLFKSNENFGNHILDAQGVNTTTHPEIVQVEIATIDSVIQQYEINPNKIRLMKLDTEGSEMAVLNGGSEFIKEYRPNIIFEFSPSLLKVCGYSPFDMLSFIDRYQYTPYVVNTINMENPKFNLTPLSVDDLVYLVKKLTPEYQAYKNIFLQYEK
jgi:FkbM family methyltransferase